MRALAPPILVVAGGANSAASSMLDGVRMLLDAALPDFQGTVIFGGTTVGVPGGVGDVAAKSSVSGRKSFKLMGYLPAVLPAGVSLHPGNDESVRIGVDFGVEQILAYWSDISALGILPGDVLVLGFGGGPLSLIEYRIALALGAAVGLVTGTKGTAEELLKDPAWAALPNLYPLPIDAATVRAFVVSASAPLDATVQLEMAKVLHQRYVVNRGDRLAENLRRWDTLPETYRKANIEQAKYALEILRTEGFAVRPASGQGHVIKDFTNDEMERMSALEHGRWNMERLRDGWRYGETRDDSRKIHNCIVSWADLPETIREYDREAVRAFPEILSNAGLELYRPSR